MRVLAAAAAACAAAIALASCTDLSGLSGSGGPEDAAATDAPSSDAAASDAGPLGPFCARDATFCDDFEDGGLAGRWSTVELGDASTLVLADDAGRDGTRGAQAELLPVDAGVKAARFHKAFLGAPARLTCSADLYLEALGAKGSTVLSVSILSSDRWFGVGLDVSAGGSFVWSAGALDDGGAFGDDVTRGPVPLARWVRVELQTDFASATLSLDGAALATVKIPPLSRTDYGLTVGLDGEGAARVRIDNVLCEASP